jgi:hypothetical protein
MEDSPLSNFETLSEIPVMSVTNRQAGIRVGDGSTSMTWPIEGDANSTKASEANVATRELITRLKASRKAPNFSFGFVDFHDMVCNEAPIEPIKDIDDNADYDPTSHGTGGTFLGAGLERAKAMADQFLAADASVPASVVILALTDGECGQPERTLQVAESIKEDSRIIIATAYFATKGVPNSAGPDLLKKVCSDPVRFYKTVYDAETLRNFFLASMTAAALTNA